LSFKASQIKEVASDIGAVLVKISGVLEDHERRIRFVEDLDLQVILEALKIRVRGVADRGKQTEALAALKTLYVLLTGKET